MTGAGCRPVAQRRTMKRAEAPSWKEAINQGHGKILRVLLFRILKMMLNAYQPKTYAATLMPLPEAGSASGAEEAAAATADEAHTVKGAS